MKRILILLSLIYSSSSAISQISIYTSEENGKIIIGYSINVSNGNFERDISAENDCRNNGGKNPRLVVSKNGYGCYAIVKGKTSTGSDAFGYFSGGNTTLNECINEAKSFARISGGAVENTIYVYRQAQGCITAPKNKSTTNSTQNEPKWSDWKKIKTSKCDLGIEYCTKRIERYQLNYQLWFYYKVRNTSNKNIRFDFHLTRNGKKEFGREHVLSPSGEDEWMHKMSANNIDGVSVTNIINTTTNKAVCDEVTTGKTNPEEEAFEVVQIESEFPGGGAAWGKFLQRNLNTDVTKNAPIGKYTVMLSFIVGKDGTISDVRCDKDPGYGTCQEAIRVLNQSPNWTPAIQNGRNVLSRKRQSITFLVSKE